MKFSDLQKKAFTLQQEKQKKSKHRVAHNENKGYRMKKLRKMYNLDKMYASTNIESMASQNIVLQASIKDRGKYLSDLMVQMKILSEKTSKEPSYLKPKTRKKSVDDKDKNKQTQNPNENQNKGKQIARPMTARI